jgi:hypothetical protein
MICQPRRQGSIITAAATAGLRLSTTENIDAVAAPMCHNTRSTYKRGHSGSAERLSRGKDQGILAALE